MILGGDFFLLPEDCIIPKKLENIINTMKKNIEINEDYIRHLVSLNLKRIRIMQNSSQLGLSIVAGLAHNFINDIENGKKGISSKTLAKLCVALQIEPHQLFLPEDKSNNDMKAYVSDFTDGLQKLVQELTDQYIPRS